MVWVTYLKKLFQWSYHLSWQIMTLILLRYVPKLLLSKKKDSTGLTSADGQTKRFVQSTETARQTGGFVVEAGWRRFTWIEAHTIPLKRYDIVHVVLELFVGQGLRSTTIRCLRLSSKQFFYSTFDRIVLKSILSWRPRRATTGSWSPSIS